MAFKSSFPGSALYYAQHLRSVLLFRLLLSEERRETHRFSDDQTTDGFAHCVKGPPWLTDVAFGLLIFPSFYLVESSVPPLSLAAAFLCVLAALFC